MNENVNSHIIGRRIIETDTDPLRKLRVQIQMKEENTYRCWEVICMIQ